MGICFNCVIFIPILAAAVYFLVYQQVDYDVHEYQVSINKDMDSIVQWWRVADNLKKIHPFLLELKMIDEKTNNIEVNGEKTTELIQRFFAIEKVPSLGGINMHFWFEVNKRVVQLKDTATIESEVLDDPLLEVSTLVQMTRSHGKTKMVETLKVTICRLMYFFNKNEISGVHRKIVDDFKTLMESN